MSTPIERELIDHGPDTSCRFAVQVREAGGDWLSNSERFLTESEAKRAGERLKWSWSAVAQVRVVEMRWAIYLAQGVGHDQGSSILRLIEQYLPRNYKAQQEGNRIWVEGYDDHGWGLDSYVIPRLASGLHAVREVVEAPDPEWTEQASVVCLHLSSSTDFTKQGWGKKVKAAGGRYTECRGRRSSKRFVDLPLIEERLIAELLTRFSDYKKTTVVFKGDKREGWTQNRPSWVDVVYVQQGAEDPWRELMDARAKAVAQGLERGLVAYTRPDRDEAEVPELLPPEPSVLPAGTVPLADTDCPECHGYGYDLFDTDAPHHAPLELQLNDGCSCAKERSGLERSATDDDVAALFVRDLEAGRPRAVQMAERLAKAAREGEWHDRYTGEYGG